MMKEMTPNLLDLGERTLESTKNRIERLARVRGRKHKYALRGYPNPTSTRVRGRNEENRCKIEYKTKP
jgi:hypothetical protein